MSCRVDNYFYIYYKNICVFINFSKSQKVKSIVIIVILLNLTGKQILFWILFLKRNFSIALSLSFFSSFSRSLIQSFSLLFLFISFSTDLVFFFFFTLVFHLLLSLSHIPFQLISFRNHYLILSPYKLISLLTCDLPTWFTSTVFIGC